VLPPARLEQLGFAIAAYPLTLLAAAMRAMKEALADMNAGRPPDSRLMGFAELREIVGFEDYYREEARYAGPRR
jgi:2-methylisocitrate lyase-like PEP mutase family enzyme